MIPGNYQFIGAVIGRLVAQPDVNFELREVISETIILYELPDLFSKPFQ